MIRFSDQDASLEKSEGGEEESGEDVRRGSSGKIEAKKGPRIPKGEKLANQKAEALGAVTLKGIPNESKIIHHFS